MKDIKGYEGLYSATEDGQIYSHRKKRFLTDKPCSGGGGYILIRLCKNGIQTSIRAHVIIASLFVNKPEGTTEVNHKNGIKTDNRVDNLEWVNRQQNIKHSFDVLKRTSATGHRHPKSKLVLDTEMGIYYECTAQAARARGITRNSLKCGLYKHGSYKGFIYA